MLFQHFGEVTPGVTGGVLGNLFRRSTGHDLTAAISSLRAQINQPI